MGMGILTTTTYFPVLAPRKSRPHIIVQYADCLSVPVSENALALAFFMFLRNFAQVLFPFALHRVHAATDMRLLVGMGRYDRWYCTSE